MDGIVETLIRSGQIGLVRSEQDVFEVSHGLSKLTWKTARWLYRAGSSSGLVGSIYERIRRTNDYSRQSLSLTLMGRDVRRQCMSESYPLIVSHPILVGLLAGRANLMYQHGEVIVPDEATVAGAALVFVPVPEAAERFKRAGYSDEQLFVSGLCIEPVLVRQAADVLLQRTCRLEQGRSLTGAFFSSGAEPKMHVEQIVRAALSAAKGKQRVVIFASRNGRLAKMTQLHFGQNSVRLVRVDTSSQIPAELPVAVLVECSSRRELDIFTARLFPHFDYFVAPAHERANWALGLGIPMFIVGPSIGTFSPLNRELLLASGVAVDLDQNAAFGDTLEKTASCGKLLAMVRAGWGLRPIDGFERIAEELTRRFGQ